MVEGIEGKVALVMGGGKGIGANIVTKLAENGAKVRICDLDEGVTRELVEHLKAQGHDVDCIIRDVAPPGAAADVVRGVVGSEGCIDILVNNAKAGTRTSLFTETPENWDLTVTILMTVPYFTSQEAMRHMQAQGSGVILNMSSIAAIYTCHESPSYHAAKAGIFHMTRYLAKQGGEFGVRVNCISPGFVVKDEDRARFDRAGNEAYREIANYVHPVKRVGTSDEIANVALFLVSDQSSFVNGQNIIVDGGLTRQEPFELVSKYVNAHTQS